MFTPWFTAEASLYASDNQYWTAERTSRITDLVAPAQLAGGIGLFPFNCGGSTDDCVALHCDHLTGKERAKCIATCNQPSICGGCDCSCSSDCTRTCARTCCRTSEGPPFLQFCCTGDCFRPPIGDGGVLTQG